MHIIIRGTHALRSLPVASFVWEQVVTGAELAGMCLGAGRCDVYWSDTD